jgi:hypothetical protein
VGYIDETSRQEEGKKGFLEANINKRYWYNSKTCKYTKNQALFFAQTPIIDLEYINKNTHMEMERKKVQFATLFQILEGVHPIVEYENRKALYSFINVP